MTDNPAFDKAALAWCGDRLKLRDSMPWPVTHPERLVLGCTVFGDVHVDRFIKFCLPSLTAAGNLEAIPDPSVFILTDADHIEMIRAKTHHIGARVEAIPDSIMFAATPAERFALVSAATTIQISEARVAGAAFHLLVPDHVYAKGFFHNLMRLAGEGHQAIVGGGLSADVERIGRDLLESDCSLPPDRLNAWAMDTLHPQFRALINNGRDDFPLSTLFLLVGEHEVCIVSPHAAPLYLSHALLCKAELKPLVAIDGQLPDLIGTEHYVPKPEDGVTYIELSGPEKPHNTADMRWSPWDFCVGFYKLTNHDRRWLSYMAAPTRIAFPDDYRPPVANLMTEDEIVARLTGTIKMLDDGYGDKVQIHDPTDVLEPPWVGAMFFDPDANVFYQARGPSPADWRFVPPNDLVGGFWKVYDFFVGAPPNDPQGPQAATRHLDAAKVRETMELNGVHVLDFGGLCWETVEGVKIYLVKIKFNRTRGFKLFFGFADEKPNPAKPVDGRTGFHFENDLLTFNHEDRSVRVGEVLGFRIEVADGKVMAFIDDVLFAAIIGEATEFPAVAMFEVADGPRPVVPGYEGAVNRHMNGAY